jgi:hypothetical protein
MNTSNDCFVAALQYKLQEQGRGSKKRLGHDAEVSPNHLSDILALRRNAGQQLKERFAQKLGTTVEEMLALGRHIIASRAMIGSASSDQKMAVDTSRLALSLMEMAGRILQSNTMYQKLLSENIQSYYQAMTSNSLNNLQDSDILQMMNELREHILLLQGDINKLKKGKESET